MRYPAREATRDLRIGLIGNGVIARQIASLCSSAASHITVRAALARNADTHSIGKHQLVQTLDELLSLGPSVVVECAGHDAVAAHGATILRQGIDFILASVGSLADADLLQRLQQAACDGQTQLSIPAGALPGIDALAAARIAGLDAVRLRSSKPPHAWLGTQADAAIDLKSITTPTVVFEGNARLAARLFPRNANVAATAALAGLGFERTGVVLVADPGATCNCHQIEASGRFGHMALRIENAPSPENAKTSMLAALSIVRLLINRAGGIVI